MASARPPAPGGGDAPPDDLEKQAICKPRRDLFGLQDQAEPLEAEPLERLALVGNVGRATCHQRALGVRGAEGVTRAGQGAEEIVPEARVARRGRDASRGALDVPDNAADVRPAGPAPDGSLGGRQPAFQ